MSLMVDNLNETLSTLVSFNPCKCSSAGVDAVFTLDFQYY